MVVHPMVAIASIVIIGVSATWLAWRLRIPSILVLLISGFVAGPAVAGLVDPDALFGQVSDAGRGHAPLLMPLVSLSVGLILYEGALSLRLAELARVGQVVRNLCTVGALMTWVTASAAARLCFGLDLPLAVLLGAILVVTGPTVIIPLLRHIRPSGAAGVALKWEGIVIDPIGASLAVLVFEAILGGEVSRAAPHVIQALLRTLIVGGGLGLLAAAALTLLLERYWVPEFLQNAVSLMLVVAAFTLSNRVQEESGLLAATVMGIALANQKRVDVRHIVEFKENLRVLLISALFVVLAARIRVEDLRSVGPGGVLFVLLLVLVARPLCVWVSTIGSRLSRAERLFLAWVAPRGVVAAAVSSVFALRLEQHGYAEARVMVPITFLVVIGTVALYGLTSPWVARRLGIADADPQGLLLVGAGRWVRRVAAALHARGYRLVLVDTNRDNASAARTEGLPTYGGSILAEHAMTEIDLGGIGRLLAVTPNDWVNALAVQRYRNVLGAAHCYQLPPRGASESQATAHRHLYGRMLFGPGVTYDTLEALVARGATVRAIPLSAEFDFPAFRTLHGPDAIVLFVVDKDGRLHVPVAGEKLDPQPGQTLIALVTEASRPNPG